MFFISFEWYNNEIYNDIKRKNLIKYWKRIFEIFFINDYSLRSSEIIIIQGLKDWFKQAWKREWH